MTAAGKTGSTGQGMWRMPLEQGDIIASRDEKVTEHNIEGLCGCQERGVPGTGSS